MDADKTNFRKERIEKLLRELEYEVVRGMMEGDINEQIGYRFIVPISKTLLEGVVHCEFRTRPVHRGAIDIDDRQPRLRVVK
jgi:hypothetical protein